MGFFDFLKAKENESSYQKSDTGAKKNISKTSFEKKGQYYVDKSGNKYYVDKFGNRYLVEKSGNKNSTDKSGNRYSAEKSSNKKSGNKYYVDKFGNRYLVEKSGNKNSTDKSGNKNSTDKSGNRYSVEKSNNKKSGNRYSVDKNSAKPNLSLNFPKNDLIINNWHRVGIEITNDGDAHAFDVTYSFTDEFEAKRIKPEYIEAKKTILSEIGIKPLTGGTIPFEITLTYQDGNKKEYTKTSEFWVNVVNINTGSYRTENPETNFSPKNSMPNHFPHQLANKYTDTSVIGKGGFAQVFKAKRTDGKEVAVKIPLSLDASTGKSFIAEIQNWTNLTHPNIVQIYDFNIMPTPYFEMELCEGSLNEIDKPVDFKEAAWIIFNTCEGLRYTHSQKIIHRDLKPHNILLKDGNPRIADWGLSKVVTKSKTSTGTSFTLFYAAPEQISNNPKTAATDIWQIGVIFYELITGELPFDGESLIEIGMNIAQVEPPLPSSLNPDATPFDAIILKCLEKDPKMRYQSAYYLQEDLSRAMNDQYAPLLKKSVTDGDMQKYTVYCGELVLVNLRTGQLSAAHRYATDLSAYAKGEVKELAETFAQRLAYMEKEGLDDVPDSLESLAELIVHKVRMRFENI